MQISLKTIHHKVQLLLLALILLFAGYYAYCYHKISEIDNKRDKLWLQLEERSIANSEYESFVHEYDRLRQDLFNACEILNIPIVMIFLLSVLNFLLLKKQKPKSLIP